MLGLDDWSERISDCIRCWKTAKRTVSVALAALEIPSSASSARSVEPCVRSLAISFSNLSCCTFTNFYAMESYSGFSPRLPARELKKPQWIVFGAEAIKT